MSSMISITKIENRKLQFGEHINFHKTVSQGTEYESICLPNNVTIVVLDFEFLSQKIRNLVGNLVSILN